MAVFCLQCGTALEDRHQEDRLRPTCPVCGFIYYLDPKVAVAVVLGDERGVLLGRRGIDPRSGYWSFPAGYVNRGEKLEEAAVREVLEELSLQVEVTGLVGVYSRSGDAVVLIVYAGEVVGGALRVDGREVLEARWFDPAELPDELAFPHDKAVVEDWLRGSLIPIR